MAGLGCGVVVSGVADFPCGLFEQAFPANASQWPRSTPGGQGIANLVVRKAFDRVCGTVVVGISVGKKRQLLVPLVPQPTVVLASYSDTGGSPV